MSGMELVPCSGGCGGFVWAPTGTEEVTCDPCLEKVKPTKVFKTEAKEEPKAKGKN